jgi:hypothetical protein
MSRLAPLLLIGALIAAGCARVRAPEVVLKPHGDTVMLKLESGGEPIEGILFLVTATGLVIDRDGRLKEVAFADLKQVEVLGYDHYRVFSVRAQRELALHATHTRGLDPAQLAAVLTLRQQAALEPIVAR